MRPDIRTYLFDIRESITSIEDYLGEATKRILAIDENVAIADARRIVNLRNFVIHGYDRLDDTVIWGVVTRDVPKLKTQVALLLADSEEK